MQERLWRKLAVGIGLTVAGVGTSRPGLAQATAPTVTREHAGRSAGIGLTFAAGDDGTLLVGLESARRDEASLTVHLASSGLDGRSARRKVQGLTLAGGTRALLRVPVTDLPIQSIRSASEVHVELEVVDPAGERSLVASDPLFSDFTADYRQASVYDGGTAARRFERLKDEELFLVRGRVFDEETGGFVEVDDLPPSTRGYGVGASRTLVSVGPAVEAGPTPQPSGVRVCAKVQATYNDAGYGEDYAAVPGSGAVQTVAASYAYARIRPSGSVSYNWQGYLNASGCTPYLTLVGNKIFSLESRHERPAEPGDSAVHVDVNVDYYGPDLPPPGLTGWSQAFFTFGGPATVNLTLGSAPASNVMAVVARMLSMPDPGIKGGNYIVWSNKGCPSSDPGIPWWDSCAMPWIKTAYIGPAGPGGIPADSLIKFVVAHELGHVVQGANFSFGSYSYDTGDDPFVAACRCDHVQSSNQLHCLQSRETFVAAAIEGFAHFYAAKVWNNPNQSDCKFVYYKEFLSAGLPFVQTPPVPKNCAQPVEWRDHYCTETAARGTEYDWLTFYWTLHTKTANKLSMADIYGIYNFDAGYETNWTQLQADALAFFGGSPMNLKYLHLVSTASAHGIDDDFSF
jgi:hypothetical protein